MPYFENKGIKIYYEIEGDGPPLVLIHGFSGNIEDSWKDSNLIETLKDRYKLILLDCRGHGRSDKPHGDSFYGYNMVNDLIQLLEHLSIKQANFLGYSMGAYLLFQLILKKPEIIICAILGGFVLTLEEREIAKATKNMEQIIDAFKAESIDKVRKPIGRAFRLIAEQRGNDLLALAAVQTSWSKFSIPPANLREVLKKIKVPVMTVVGSSEILLGDKTLVAQLVPDACHFQIQGKDHLNVTSDPKFHMVVRGFLALNNK